MQKFLDLLSSILSRPSLDTQSANKSQSLYSLVMTCNQKDILHLDSLTRYFEMPYNALLTRGIWLLTLVRDAEIKSKRLAIIEIDEESGMVTNVSPITIS